MDQCSFVKPDGERCQKPAKGPKGVCWSHDPANAAERVRTAQRGGRGKTHPETRAVKDLMDHLTEQVLVGEISPSVLHAAVAAQNIKLRAIEIERRLEEYDVRAELEEYKREVREYKAESEAMKEEILLAGEGPRLKGGEDGSGDVGFTS